MSKKSLFCAMALCCFGISLSILFSACNNGSSTSKSNSGSPSGSGSTGGNLAVDSGAAKLITTAGPGMIQLSAFCFKLSEANSVIQKNPDSAYLYNVQAPAPSDSFQFLIAAPSAIGVPGGNATVPNFENGFIYSGLAGKHVECPSICDVTGLINNVSLPNSSQATNNGTSAPIVAGINLFCQNAGGQKICAWKLSNSILLAFSQNTPAIQYVIAVVSTINPQGTSQLIVTYYGFVQGNMQPVAISVDLSPNYYLSVH